ncbi:hypothetical protein C8R45DRAFT_1177920 [Mycena sanguinolenta]|nr:hypothetical protein C8R45DRAFT_1177920 [Mycena sanguinolenta]
MDPSACSSFAADDLRLPLETDTSFGSIDSSISTFLDIDNSPAFHSQKPAPSPSPDIFGNSEMDLANLDAAFWEGTSLSGDPELIMPTVETISSSTLDLQAQESDVDGSADSTSEDAQDWDEGDSADDEEEEEDQLMSSEPRSGPPPKCPLVDPFLATSTPPCPNIPKLNYNSPLVLYTSTDEDENEQVGGGRMREATPPESPMPMRLRYRLTPTPNAGAGTQAAVIRCAESALMLPPPVPAHVLQSSQTTATGKAQSTRRRVGKKKKAQGDKSTIPASVAVTAPSGATTTASSGAATTPITQAGPVIPAAPSKKLVNSAATLPGPTSAALAPPIQAVPSKKLKVGVFEGDGTFDSGLDGAFDNDLDGTFDGAFDGDLDGACDGNFNGDCDSGAPYPATACKKAGSQCPTASSDHSRSKAGFESVPLPPPPRALQSPPHSPSPSPPPTPSVVDAPPDVPSKPSRTGKLTAAQETSLTDCFTKLLDIIGECSRATGLDTERILRAFANYLDDKFEHERPNRWNLYQKYANHLSNILTETARIKTEAEMAEIGDDPGSAPLLNAAELSAAYQIFSKEYPGKCGEELLLKDAEYIAVETVPTHEQRQRRFESDMRKLTGMAFKIAMTSTVSLCLLAHTFTKTRLCELHVTPALTDFFKNLKYSADDILGIAKTTAYAWDIDRLHDIKGRGEDIGSIEGVEGVEGVDDTATPDVQRARPVRRIKSERPPIVKNDYSGMSASEKKAAQRTLVKNRNQTTKSANQALKLRLIKASEDDLGNDIFDQGNGFMWTITPSVLARENVVMIGYPSDHVRLPNETPPGKASSGWRIDDPQGLEEALDARGTAGEGLRFVRRPYKQGNMVIFSHDYSLLPPSCPTGSPEYQKHWRRLWSGIYGLDPAAPVISKLPMSVRWQGKARKRSATLLDEEDVDAGGEDDAESEEEPVPPPKKKARAARTASRTRTSAPVGTAPVHAPSPRVTRSAAAAKTAEPPQQAGGKRSRQGGKRAVRFEDDESGDSDDSSDKFFADDSPQPKKRTRTPAADAWDANDGHFAMDLDEGTPEQPVAEFQRTLYSAQMAVPIAEAYSSGSATVALGGTGSRKTLSTTQLQKLANTTHQDPKQKGRQNPKISRWESAVSDQPDGLERPKPRPLKKKPDAGNAAGTSVAANATNASNVANARNGGFLVPPAAPFTPQPEPAARSNTVQPVVARPVAVPHAPPVPPPAHAPSPARSGLATAAPQHIPAGTHAFAAQPPATIDPAALIAAMDPSAMANLMTALAPQLLTAMLNLPRPQQQ